MRSFASRLAGVSALMALELCLPAFAWSQVNENCTVSVLNRNVRMNADGSWVLPNIPANFGPVRARVTCVVDGQTISGESEPFTVPPNGVVNLPHVLFGQTTPIPTALTITAPAGAISQAGGTAQLAVTARYADGTVRDVTLAASGTGYTISNTAIATITADGLVQAVSSGTVLIQATQEGASGIASIRVSLGGADADGDGIPDSVEISLGMNPNDPVDALEDFDRDGLTNLREWQMGTAIRNADTDSDGLLDGREVDLYHTNPLLADTDGDRIPDGVEVQTATNPLDASSYSLRAATASSVLTPASFQLSTSVLFPEATVQLRWQVRLIDGRTTLDLTSDPRTLYGSSDPQVCNFGAQKGLVFASATGNCVVNISQNDLSVTVPGTVEAFTPSEIAQLTVAGAVAVDVSGNAAYVAAGSNGLAIVDLSNPASPRVRAALSDVGNAQGVRAAGPYVFVADATGFLRVVRTTNPDAPALAASLQVPGAPIALAVHGQLAAVAAQVGGISLVDIANPEDPVLLSSVMVSGPAVGVDFDPSRGLAAIAMGAAGLQIVDLSTPTAPRLLGSLAGGNVRRVLFETPTIALLADTQRSVTAVDLTHPGLPAITTSTPANLGGAPVDIASFGPLAMTADVSFGAAVPILSLANPQQPNVVSYWNLVGRGFSSGVAMDAQFGYLTTPSLLRIYRYRQIEDNFGNPPTVEITAPSAGTSVVHGDTVTMVVNATDDVAVAAVNMVINGQPVFTAGGAPYQFTFTAPTAGSTLALDSTALDFAGSIGTAATVTVNLVPDPLTTAVGRVLVADGSPIAGSTVTCDGQSAVTLGDGTFSLGGLPTVPPLVSCFAHAADTSGVILGGGRAPQPAVRGGTTQIGDITVGPVPIITSLGRRSALVGVTVAGIGVTGMHLLDSAFAISGGGASVASAATDPLGLSARLDIIAGLRAGTYALVATTTFGSSSSEPTPQNRFTVVDPSSISDTDGDGVLDVLEAVMGTDPLDPASFGDPAAAVLSAISATPVTVLNYAVPLPAGGTSMTIGGAVTVINLASTSVTQPRPREVDPLAFSAFNLVGLTGGQPLRREVLGLPVTIINEDQTAGPDGHGVGPGAGGGTGQPQEADAVFLSVLNVAPGAPLGRSRGDEPGRLAVHRRDTAPDDRLRLPSRAVIDVHDTFVAAPGVSSLHVVVAHTGSFGRMP